MDVYIHTSTLTWICHGSGGVRSGDIHDSIISHIFKYIMMEFH